jgi:NADPH-dependent curcumin reductase
MAELKNRQWLLAARPQGMIKETDFRWNETLALPPKDGELLIRNLALDFDPTQRGWVSMDTFTVSQRVERTDMPAISVGTVMRSNAIGQVIESKKPGFTKGDLVHGIFGWEDYTVTDGRGFFSVGKLPKGTDPILSLSVLGMTGLKAYFGTLNVGQPKSGETFVVSGAAGATGSVAGMIAKLKGCRVIGIAGGPQKCEWLTGEAGFDAAIDYKHENVGEALPRLCPKGIDVYFDNVGGEILELVLDRLAFHARVVLCGAISVYNEAAGVMAHPPRNYFRLIFHGARMEGFMLSHFAQQYREGRAALAKWHAEGKIKNQVDLQHGLENAPKTIIRLFTGANLGKQLLTLGNLE